MCIIFYGEFMNDYIFEKLFKLEKKAFKKNEIPVGAIIVYNNKIIAQAYNKREKSNMIANHAEILAIHKAAKKLNTWKLYNCILYVSLFPCPMCASAIQQSRIKKVYYINDSYNLAQKKISENILKNNELNHQVEYEKTTFDSNSLSKFFKKIRS